MLDENATDERRTTARRALLHTLAILRERGSLPSVDLPPLDLEPRADGYLSAVALKLSAAAQDAEPAPEGGDPPTPQQGDRDARRLANAIAAHLSETVDLVPAYAEVAAVEVTDDALILIRFRA